MTKLKTFTKREIIQEVIDELQELVDCVEPAVSNEGLCGILHKVFFDNVECLLHCGFFTDCFETWENFSGNLDYPIVHPYLPASAAYGANANKWTYDDYGMSRRDLVEHIIERLEEIKNQY